MYADEISRIIEAVQTVATGTLELIT